MQKRLLLTSIVLAGSLGLPVLLFTQRMAIYDWSRLRNYSPPAFVSELADNTSMNSGTRRLFYVYHPAVQSKTDFNESCREDEQTIVLGCYVSGKGIYLLDITDSRLNGIEEVTAAHEVLHAAYERLSQKDKRRVDDMLTATLNTVKEKRILETVELYRKQDASKLSNELHSILGTEVRNLSPDLEAYYQRYFIDRSKIVSLSEQYESVFTERRDQIATYDAELESLKQQIDDSQKSLEQSLASLSSQRATLENYRDSGDIAAYNAGVPSYNRSVSRYNTQIDQLASLVAQYNEIVSKRNALASEEQDLVKAIDSRETVPARQ